MNNDSIKRRSKRSNLKDNNLIDNYDLPISTKYIDNVLNCDKDNIILNYKSNWLNSISITINYKNQNHLNNIIDCFKLKSFINDIDLVKKYNNNNKLNNQNQKKMNNNNKFQNKLLKNDLMESSSTIDQSNLDSTSSSQPSSNIYFNKTINEIFQSKNYNISFDESFYGLSYKQLTQCNINKLHEKGLFGTGIKILIIDSGFYKDHQSLKNLNIIGEYNWVDKTNNTQDQFDPDLLDPSLSQNAHGTATLSVIGGFAPGKLIGPAFNASYFLAKTEIISEENLVEEDYWIAALELGERMGMELVTSSLGYKEWYRFSDLNGKTTRISKAAELAIKKGLVIVISAGNDDRAGIDSPTDGEYVIAVGGVKPNGKDKAYISSIGPTSDGRIKPDIMALGEQVQIAYFTGSDHYRLELGTSFSSQIVAGGIALIMEQHPNWSVYQIYDAITKTSSQSKKPDIYLGYGVFDAYAALQYDPTPLSCLELGCQNNGICNTNETSTYKNFKKLFIGQCKCPPAYYGLFCQYKRVSCDDSLCKFRYSVCQINLFNNNNSESFNCENPNNLKKLTNYYDPYYLNYSKLFDLNGNNHYDDSINSSKIKDSLDVIVENNSILSNDKFILIICLIVGLSVLIITVLLVVSIKYFINIKQKLKNNHQI